MRRVALAGLALALMGLTASTWAEADRRHHRGRHELGPAGPHARHEMMAERLGLNDEQREAWTSAHEAFRSEIEPLHREMYEAREQLHTLIEADTPDPTAIGEQMLLIKDLRGQLAEKRVELHETLSGVLTPEQREKFEMFAERRKERRERWDLAPGRGRPRFGRGFGFDPPPPPDPES
ncbi:MAG: Spy/CpxP family protein refolding chaperone [Acidobacteriota bacterium]|nr:MAG: Spy/CpxP family protein refolding chaperone [Acidobacteriota bacterium]